MFYVAKLNVNFFVHAREDNSLLESIIF